MSRRLAAAALVVGLVLLFIAAMVGWALRDSLGVNPDLSMTWNGLLRVLAMAFPVALGAVLGAAGALIVAIVNREEARRARFSANALSAPKRVVDLCVRHHREGANRQGSREWTAVQPTQKGVLREMARCLRRIAAGRAPK